MNIYDMAQKAGVSIATISRVVNGSPNVSEKTRRKVEEILKENNYVPNAIARGLVTKSTKTIGILTVDIRDLYYANATYIIEHEFSNYGYNVILCNTGRDNEEKIKYIKMLMEKKVDGIILVGSVFKDRHIEKAIINASVETPIVMVNGFIDKKNIFSIICDDTYGIEKCVDYLHTKGYRDIVYLQDDNTYSAQCKAQGFKAGMDKNKSELYPYSILNVEKGLQGGCQAVELLIKSKHKFNAIIAGEDVTALGAVKTLRQMGINIPSDVAVIGYNNSIFTQCSEPELTSVDNKVEITGIGAVRLLNDIFEGKNVPSKTVITPELIIKKST